MDLPLLLMESREKRIVNIFGAAAKCKKTFCSGVFCVIIVLVINCQKMTCMIDAALPDRKCIGSSDRRKRKEEMNSLREWEEAFEQAVDVEKIL